MGFGSKTPAMETSDKSFSEFRVKVFSLSMRVASTSLFEENLFFCDLLQSLSRN